jgi:putative transposase
MNAAAPPWFNPYAPIDIHQRDLPHWQQPGRLFFLTWRLADSLPSEKLAQWKAEQTAWLARNPSPWSVATVAEYHQNFPTRLEEWLDSGMGECLLTRPTIADTVAATLRHFDGDRYELECFVIMPNHVHLLVRLDENERLEKTVQSWKGFAARRINRALNRTGSLWQEGYWDRMIRNPNHLYRCSEYIRQNPAKANLPPTSYLLWKK